MINEPWSYNKKEVTLAYFAGFLGGHGTNVYVHYMIYLQVTDLYGHQISTAGIWRECTNWQMHPRFDLFFEATWVKKFKKSNFGSIRMVQIVSAAHKDLWSCVHRLTNEPLSYTIN